MVKAFCSSFRVIDFNFSDNPIIALVNIIIRRSYDLHIIRELFQNIRRYTYAISFGSIVDYLIPLFSDLNTLCYAIANKQNRSFLFHIIFHSVTNCIRAAYIPMCFVEFNIFRLILPKFLYILYHNSLQLSIRKDNMVNVVLHISLKKIFHCGVYQYACLIRVIFAVFLSRSRSSYRLGNC